MNVITRGTYKLLGLSLIVMGLLMIIYSGYLLSKPVERPGKKKIMNENVTNCIKFVKSNSDLKMEIGTRPNTLTIRSYDINNYQMLLGEANNILLGCYGMKLTDFCMGNCQYADKSTNKDINFSGMNFTMESQEPIYPNQ